MFDITGILCFPPCAILNNSTKIYGFLGTITQELHKRKCDYQSGLPPTPPHPATPPPGERAGLIYSHEAEIFLVNFFRGAIYYLVVSL